MTTATIMAAKETTLLVVIFTMKDVYFTNIHPPIDKKSSARDYFLNILNDR
jgi:hypothetical protein